VTYVSLQIGVSQQTLSYLTKSSFEHRQENLHEDKNQTRVTAQWYIALMHRK